MSPSSRQRGEVKPARCMVINCSLCFRLSPYLCWDIKLFRKRLAGDRLNGEYLQARWRVTRVIPVRKLRRKQPKFKLYSELTISVTAGRWKLVGRPSGDQQSGNTDRCTNPVHC